MASCTLFISPPPNLRARRANTPHATDSKYAPPLPKRLRRIRCVLLASPIAHALLVALAIAVIVIPMAVHLLRRPRARHHHHYNHNHHNHHHHQHGHRGMRHGAHGAHGAHGGHVRHVRHGEHGERLRYLGHTRHGPSGHRERVKFPPALPSVRVKKAHLRHAWPPHILQHVCYCTVRRKFLLPMGRVFPETVKTVGVRVKYASMDELKINKKQAVTWVAGMSLLVEGGTMNLKGLVEMRGIAKKLGREVKLAGRWGTNEVVEWVLGDMGKVEIGNNGLWCFENVVGMKGGEEKGLGMWLKGRMGDLFGGGIVEKCWEEKANKKTIWVRKGEEDMAKGVLKELRVHEVETIEVGEEKEQGEEWVRRFNNRTMLIGKGWGDGVLFMPSGSVVIDSNSRHEVKRAVEKWIRQCVTATKATVSLDQD